MTRTPFRPFQTSYLGYWLLLAMLVIAGTLNLATPLLTVLFSVFILNSLCIGKRKWIATIVFLLLVFGFLYASGYFIKQAVVALPRIAEDSWPRFVDFAREQGLTLPNLPFDNEEEMRELKTETMTWLKSELRSIGNFAKFATKEFAFVFIGIVVGISLFFNARIDLNSGNYPLRNNLYSFACGEIAKRFASFYRSFARVMGAQLIISTINTGFTAAYVLFVGLPHAALVIALTFICGMLPIIGNLISNTVIVALSIVVSPQLAVGSLAYLVVVHKLEYFLNSKVIGDRIKNPVWLTLVGVLLGERLMGIPGIILAPVVLDFIKNEASTIEMDEVPGLIEREENERLRVID